MQSDPNTHLEVERKYEVAIDATVPRLDCTVFRFADPTVHTLSARYFDTADFLLAQHRIAVRHRRGGTDAGWHVKQRGSAGVLETEWPDAEDMPVELLTRLADLIGAPIGRVDVIARIDTTRTSYPVLDERGTQVAELVDDTVRAFDAVADVSRAWREWEVELVGSEGSALFAEIEPVLVQAGATLSLAESKIGRTMGSTLPRAIEQGSDADTIAALAIIDVADRMTALQAPGAEMDQRIARLRKIADTLAK